MDLISSCVLRAQQGPQIPLLIPPYYNIKVGNVAFIGTYC